MTEFPEVLTGQLTKLGNDLRKPLRAFFDGGNKRKQLGLVVDLLGQQPINRFHEKTNEIQREMRLWQSNSALHLALLKRYPQLAPLFVFHGSGFCRQAELKQIVTLSGQPFLLTGLFHRLNDWVPQVRKAARAAVQRVEPSLAVSDFRMLLPHLPLHMRSWARNSQNSAVLENWLEMVKAYDATVVWLLGCHTGPALAILNAMLPDDSIDRQFREFALTAKHPAIRAAAARFLLSGEVSWTEGYRHEWIDKTMNLKRRVPNIQKRVLTVPKEGAQLAIMMNDDQSAKVRRVLADWLIEQGPQVDTAPIISRMRRDKDFGVLSRMGYFDRKWSS